ncbi:hypothetical protein METBIDRAFT_36935 [Metschnikowia bicuspidata var. bicuspidata NRRL YB-4993]|uniref:Pkr1-domain-containing protein n=1 Tax=Metschnikowia bicuspidata var. bicuspidata NRRL YB-4993 TaxID=869754 RepID=A0A1A0HIC7_9ASCO|nr:hypothetical protein METBIDRAFT_36935 [Metschnikowia bicuspidata var. bicuspidata NRRL YB-4993]OBA23593.1 hypothetical protein METBIDRAFT_36935 [Metschnikowia bicuspidata var. bicuspidata NRRL YB-4993]
MSFFVELWESIFTPGTSPALMKATHASFILLLLSLLFLIFYSGSIHFINLFVIASCLYAAVIWFVNELKNIKLKDNEELAKETGGLVSVPSEKKQVESGSTSGVKKPIGAPTKRKT